MFASLDSETHLSHLNRLLLQLVPVDAVTILEVRGSDDSLGRGLQTSVPARRIWKLVRRGCATGTDETEYEEVFRLESEEQDPPLTEGAIDRVIYKDVLEQLRNPLATLRRHRRFLSPGGKVLACVRNAQHHTLLTTLTSGEFSNGPSGPFSPTQSSFHSRSSLFKLFLDAGLSPTSKGTLSVPVPEPLWQTIQPLLAYLRLHPQRTRPLLEAYQHILEGAPFTDIAEREPSDSIEPMTFVVCVNDAEQLRTNLLASPCLGPTSRHEVLVMSGCRSAADGLNEGLHRARNERVVCLHQDVYLPAGWDRRFQTEWTAAEARHGRVGVVGVYGVRLGADRVRRAGHVLDREHVLNEPVALPAAVDTLDELLLGTRKTAGLVFDPGLGFHFYGADICLQARERGLTCLALDALCFHNSRSVGLPEEFFTSAGAFAHKWRMRLPLATSCVVINPDGTMHLS